MSITLIVQLGLVTENLNRQWYEPQHREGHHEGEAGGDRAGGPRPTVWIAIPEKHGAASCRSSKNWGTAESTLAHLQTDADFAGFIIGEVNSGLFKRFLYFEDRGEVSFHYPFILLDALERRQADPGAAGKFTLAPAQERPRRPYLRRVSHRFAVFMIRSRLTTSRL
jgi:hypothetical protein